MTFSTPSIVTSPLATRLREMVGQLLTENWVTTLFSELSERQAGSLPMVEELRKASVSNHVLWPFHAPPLPMVVTEATGCRIADVDGNSYLDCHLGFGAQALHGHNPEPVVEFVRNRLARSPGNGYFHPVELDLVRLLHEILPHCQKFAFLNSGTEATQAAIRLTRAYTGRRLVAKFEGSLHGIHDLAAHNTAFWYHGHPVEPFPPVYDTGVVPTPALAGVPVADSKDLLVLPYDQRVAMDLIERHRNELACIVAEPVSSAFPFEEIAIPLIKEVADRCGRLRVPFVLDEVLTGFRCGIGGAGAHHDIRADLYCYGKVLTGLGLPLSAVAGRSDIMDLIQTSGVSLTDIGHKTCVQTTHAGNFLAICAAYASLNLLLEKGEDYYEQTRAKVTSLRDRLERFRSEHDIPLRLLGFGDFIGSFAFVAQDCYDDYRKFAAAINPLGFFLLTLLLRRRGVYTLSLPMLFTGGAHSRADLDELYSAVTDSALEMKRHGFPFLLSDETHSEVLA
jgi:glutamate-1-semialdehyde 2,1-aminomutase